MYAKSRWFSRRRPRTPCASSAPVVRGRKPSLRVRASPRTHPFQGSACCHRAGTRAIARIARGVRATRRCPPDPGDFRDADHARRVPPPLSSSEGISPRRACAHPLVRTLYKAPRAVIARAHVTWRVLRVPLAPLGGVRNITVGFATSTTHAVCHLPSRRPGAYALALRARIPLCALFPRLAYYHCEGTRALVRLALEVRATRPCTRKSRWFLRRRPRSPVCRLPSRRPRA